MNRWSAALCVITVLVAWRQLRAATPGEPKDYAAKLQSNYLLGCGGCHGVDGVSNSNLVPDLRDQVGYYMATQEGRAYLVRLPNVAFYTASNDELTAILNFVVFEIGGSSTPAGTKPYTCAEVAELRKHPLNEVSLVDYRSRLVEMLISHHKASDRLRTYGMSAYQDIGAAARPSPKEPQP